MPDLLIIFVIALLVFGPKELPKIGRTIGKAMAEFRRASDELREGIQREIDLAEREGQPPHPPAEEPVGTPAPGTPSPAPPRGLGPAGGHQLSRSPPARRDPECLTRPRCPSWLTWKSSGSG